MTTATSFLRRITRSGRLLGVGFAGLGAFVLASVVLVTLQQDYGARLRDTLRTELLMAEALSLMQDEVIGQRGYLLTGDDLFLAPYRDARLLLAQTLKALRLATRGDAQLSADVDVLQDLSDRKSAKLAQSLTLFGNGDPAGAVDLVRRREGNDLVTAIRERIERMDARTDGLLDQQRKRYLWTGAIATAAIATALALMGLVALAGLAEVRRRARLTRFLPAEVASRLAEGDEDLRRGRTTPVAVAFVDMRDSTGFARTLAPIDFAAALTLLREHVCRSAARHGGMIDKFIGDGALVVFGALEGRGRAGEDAVAFGRDLLGRLDEAHAPFAIGIGLHWGEAFSGVISAGGRQEFTVVGDVVNTAAKIEKSSRRHGVRLVASAAVLQQAGEEVASWHRLGTGGDGDPAGATALYADDAEPRRRPAPVRPPLRLASTSGLVA